MAWWDTLSSLLGERRVRIEAARIAQVLRDPLWERVEHRAAQMTVCEARGYVRAKAVALVRAEVNRALRLERGLGEWARSPLTHEATEEAVELVLNLHRAGRPLRAPVPLRRAA